MVLKILLLLISVSSFLSAGRFEGGDEEKGLLIKQFILLLISFLALAALFIKTRRFQDLLCLRLDKKFLIIILSMGFIFFLFLNYQLHGEDGDYVVSRNLDSISYFIQAKIFSTGHINVPSHRLKEFFTTGYFINDGKFYSKYFPGWPLILSIGILLRLPWVINPLFGILTLLLIYLIGEEIYDRETAIFAVMLLLFSSTFYIMNQGYLSDPAALFFTALFFYLMVKTLGEPKILTSALAGLSLGIAFLIRPYSAIAISLPVLGYLFLMSLKGREKTLIQLLVVILACLPAPFILLVYNHFQTGSAFLSPFQYYNPFDRLGFGLRSADLFIKPQPYTPFDSLKNLFFNSALLNLKSIPFLFVFLFVVLINKKNKWDILLFTTGLAIIFLQMFYFARSIRYYYVAFFAFSLLAARGINLSGISFSKIFPGSPIKNLNYFVLLFIVVANIFVVISPQRVLQQYKIHQQLRDPYVTVKRRGISNAVVFVKSVPERFNNITSFIQNPLDFNGDVLFSRDLKERNIELMEYYPARKFYIYEFDQKSKSGKLTRLR